MTKKETKSEYGYCENRLRCIAIALFVWLWWKVNNWSFPCRYERYERALVKGHKQSLDRMNNKENVDIDVHKYKSQVLQSMQEGNKLRFVNKIHMGNIN